MQVSESETSKRFVSASGEKNMADGHLYVKD